MYCLSSNCKVSHLLLSMVHFVQYKGKILLQYAHWTNKSLKILRKYEWSLAITENCTSWKIACGCQTARISRHTERRYAAVAQRRGKRAICSRGATLSLGAGLISDAQRVAHASLSGPRGRKMGTGVGPKVKTRCFPAAACINHLRHRPDGPSFFASRRRIHRGEEIFPEESPREEC